MALEDRLTQVNADLAEASTELTGLVAALRQELADNGFTPVAAEKLTSIEAFATALKNIVPNPGT